MFPPRKIVRNIKYGVVKGSGAAAGNFRPEHHSFCATSGRFFYGSNAKYKSYELPASIVKQDGWLFCRSCKEPIVELQEGEKSAKKIGKRIEKFRVHEKKCKK